MAEAFAMRPDGASEPRTSPRRRSCGGRLPPISVGSLNMIMYFIGFNRKGMVLQDVPFKASEGEDEDSITCLGLF